MIRIAETFAIFAAFAVDKEWARCWCKDRVVGRARNRWFFPLESTSHKSWISHLAGTGANDFEIRLGMLYTSWKGLLRFLGEVTVRRAFVLGVV